MTMAQFDAFVAAWRHWALENGAPTQERPPMSSPHHHLPRMDARIDAYRQVITLPKVRDQPASLFTFGGRWIESRPTGAFVFYDRDGWIITPSEWMELSGHKITFPVYRSKVRYDLFRARRDVKRARKIWNRGWARFNLSPDYTPADDWYLPTKVLSDPRLIDPQRQDRDPLSLFGIYRGNDPRDWYQWDNDIIRFEVRPSDIFTIPPVTHNWFAMSEWHPRRLPTWLPNWLRRAIINAIPTCTLWDQVDNVQAVRLRIWPHWVVDKFEMENTA
jgi:hypothetical protein